MARISREQWFFDGEQIYKIVNVNSKGVFSMPVPQKVQDLLGAPKKVEAVEKDACEKIWKNLLAEYTEAKTSTRKVILFKVESQASFKVDDEWFQGDDFHFNKGLILGVSASVQKEQIVNRATGPHYNYYHVKSQIPSSMQVGSHNVNYAGRQTSWNCMEWTEERELFFTRLGLALEDMIWNIHQFLSSELLSAMIDEGKTPLLPGGSE